MILNYMKGDWASWHVLFSHLGDIIFRNDLWRVQLLWLKSRYVEDQTRSL